MTTEEARQYFKDSKLSYLSIKPLHIRRLNMFIESELLNYLMGDNPNAKQMDMRVSHMKKKEIKHTEKNGLEYAYLKVDGSYFSGRESVSFNRSGFIGFCGELSGCNATPILKAFCKWCDWMRKELY